MLEGLLRCHRSYFFCWPAIFSFTESASQSLVISLFFPFSLVKVSFPFQLHLDKDQILSTAFTPRIAFCTMPSATTEAIEQPKNGLTKFTNCRLLRGNSLVKADLWVSSITGKIANSQACFFDELVLPDETVDLGGRIVSPGMIECQLNGAFGFNFSTLLDDMSQYGKTLKEVNKQLVETGVTSYVPTITSQRPELYQAVSLSFF